MKPAQEHIDRIKTAFEKMQSKEDLLRLLNEVKPLIYGKKTVPFALKQLTWHANPKLGGKRYEAFHIKKKSGADRSIHAPVKGLKALQKTLALILQAVFEPHNAATGFVWERSIVDNAKLHVGSNYVYNIDLKDVFQSIDQARVWKTLQLKPFNLNETATEKPFSMGWGDFQKNYLKTKKPVKFYKGKGRVFVKTPLGRPIHMSNNFNAEKDAYVLQAGSSLRTQKGKSLKNTLWLVNKIPDTSRLGIANIIASLCCTEMEVERKNEAGEWEKVKRNVLPQGAPTSPVITNIVCQKLDYLLTGVAKRFRLKYSRYADDISFSSKHNVYKPGSEFIIELHRILAEQGFRINETKTRLQKDGHRKEVTGLLVNDKVNVQKRYIKQLRMWLYYWERYGYEKASIFFLQQYTADKTTGLKGKPEMKNVISGKLDFLKMVKGEDNELYKKLQLRFDCLTGKSDKSNEEPPRSKLRRLGIFRLLMGSSTPPTKEKIIERGLPPSETALYLEEHERMNNPNQGNRYEKLPVWHEPKSLVALLKELSSNDSVLKYTTHSWGNDRDLGIFKDLSEFLGVANEQYRKLTSYSFYLNNTLNAKIWAFLFNKEVSKDGWGHGDPKKRIYFGWSSPELLEACNKNPSLHPEDFILPEQYQIQRGGKTLQKFKHIIDVFKNEIEIRDENDGLLNLILNKHDKYLNGFSAPKISNLVNKNFYTDVQWLSEGLDLIFEGIQKRPQHPEVEYAVTEETNKKLVLTILHRNSFQKGRSIHDNKLNLKGGDFSSIKNCLINLCDWSIESEFAEGAYRINYLSSLMVFSNGISDEIRLGEPFRSIPTHEKIEAAEGFKHILTFYK